MSMNGTVILLKFRYFNIKSKIKLIINLQFKFLILIHPWIFTPQTSTSTTWSMCGVIAEVVWRGKFC